MMNVVGNDLAISAKEFIGQTIYLKHGNMQEIEAGYRRCSGGDFARFVDSNIKEGKNNVI